MKKFETCLCGIARADCDFHRPKSARGIHFLPGQKIPFDLGDSVSFMNGHGNDTNLVLNMDENGVLVWVKDPRVSK